MQKDNVLQFLGAHRFPLGIVSCADTLSTDAHMKTLYLARLIKEVRTPAILQNCSAECVTVFA